MASFNTLRFPILFGGFLAFAVVGFTYREKLFPNIEAEREKLWKEDPEGKELIRATIAEAKMKRTS